MSSPAPPSFALDEPRAECHRITVPGRGEVVVRDQLPLRSVADRLVFPDDGWDLSRYCRFLNDFVFFWPGDACSPSSPYGRDHFRRYLSSGEAITFVRVDSEKVLRRCEALYSCCNSGAPSQRESSPERGPWVFQSASQVDIRSSVVEVVFQDALVLRRTFPLRGRDRHEFARG